MSPRAASAISSSSSLLGEFGDATRRRRLQRETPCEPLGLLTRAVEAMPAASRVRGDGAAQLVLRTRCERVRSEDALLQVVDRRRCLRGRERGGFEYEHLFVL